MLRPLPSAWPRGKTALHRAAEHGHVEVLAVLATAHVDVDQPTRAGSTPLHFAAQHGHAAAVAELLKLRAAVDQRDTDGGLADHGVTKCAERKRRQNSGNSELHIKTKVRQSRVDRVAVLIAGTLRRFNLKESRKLVAALTRDFEVDIFLSLFDAPSEGWRTLSSRFQQDPQFEGLSRSGVQSVIENKLSMPGSMVGGIKVFDQYNTEQQDVEFIDTTRWWDLTELHKGQGRIARSNLILMLKELESLWDIAQSRERLRSNYSYVMILRDDGFWFRNLDLSQLLRVGGVQKMGSGSGQGGHMYSVLCETGQVHLRKGGINDWIFVLDRAAAETFGKCYSRLAHPATFGNTWLKSGYADFTNVWNSETFYLFLAKFADIKVIEVPTFLLPMQRAALLDGKFCLYKICDSHSENVPWLEPERDMHMC
eukprot:Skav203947  [mRNA]  locus=scaffold391:189933:197689:- [translate_table: standard]